MKSQHTPGPFEFVASDGDVDAEYYVQECNQKAIVASVPMCCTPEWTLANARLFAAAPELLALAENLLVRLDNLTTQQFSIGGDKPEREALREIIARAKNGKAAT